MKGAGNLSVSGGGEVGRRRSVHFGACPATVIVSEQIATAGSSATASKDDLDADDELDEEDEDEAAAGSLLMPQRAAAAAYLRRRSAPASAIRGATASLLMARSRPGEDEIHPAAAGMSPTIKALDPELRRSLNKLCFTKLENPEGDLDVVKPKLLGRDDLELYRLKQLKKQQHKEVGGAAASGGGGGGAFCAPDDGKKEREKAKEKEEAATEKRIKDCESLRKKV